MDKKILQEIADYLGVAPEDLDKQASIKDDLGLGPIELNDLLNQLSIKFDVYFSADETANLQKIEDLIVLIEDNSIE